MPESASNHLTKWEFVEIKIPKRYNAGHPSPTINFRKYSYHSTTYYNNSIMPCLLSFTFFYIYFWKYSPALFSRETFQSLIKSPRGLNCHSCSNALRIIPSRKNRVKCELCVHESEYYYRRLKVEVERMCVPQCVFSGEGVHY